MVQVNSWAVEYWYRLLLHIGNLPISPNRKMFLNLIAMYGWNLYALVCGLFISRWVPTSLGKTNFRRNCRACVAKACNFTSYSGESPNCIVYFNEKGAKS